MRDKKLHEGITTDQTEDERRLHAGPSTLLSDSSHVMKQIAIFNIAAVHGNKA